MTSAMEEKQQQQHELPTMLASEDRHRDEQSSEDKVSLKQDGKDETKDGEEEKPKTGGFGDFYVCECAYGLLQY
jgi:hypothetical protein